MRARAGERILSLMRTAMLSLFLASILSSSSTKPEHVEREIRGWKVLVNRDLIADEPLATRSLALLDAKLYDVERTVPAAALAKLRAVPIWIARDDPVTPCMCYHPSVEWLKEHGFDPRKARAVEIANAERFVEWSAHQPSMVLHELAHAYHDRELGFAHAGVAEAFARAKERKRYDCVLHWDGTRSRSYALENPQELFAEASEAWFGTNDMYPFVHAELAEHDPELARLLATLWGG